VMTDGESIDLEKTYLEAKEERQDEDGNSGGNWISISFGSSKQASRGDSGSDDDSDDDDSDGDSDDDSDDEDTNDEDWGGKPRPADGEGM
jgi:hypothetical protein